MTAICDGCAKPIERIGTDAELRKMSALGLCGECCKSGTWGSPAPGDTRERDAAVAAFLAKVKGKVA